MHLRPYSLRVVNNDRYIYTDEYDHNHIRYTFASTLVRASWGPERQPLPIHLSAKGLHQTRLTRSCVQRSTHIRVATTLYRASLRLGIHYILMLWYVCFCQKDVVRKSRGSRRTLEYLAFPAKKKLAITE